METSGSSNNTVTVAKSFTAPDYSSIDTAKESLLAFTVADDMREKTWSQIEDADLDDYINKHMQTEASKLGVDYAQKAGLILAPADVEVIKTTSLIVERDEDTGEVANC